MFDAVCVDSSTMKVKWVMGPKSERDADACVELGIIRQGVADRFFVVCPHGKYKEGSSYEGCLTAPPGHERG